MEVPPKHTLFLRDLLPEPDPERIIFPGGVVCGVVPHSVTEVAMRIELLAEDHSHEKIGIMRHLFVGYTPNRVILDLARRSNYVVEVRTIDWVKRPPREGCVRDLLVVKSADERMNRGEGRLLAPSMWLEKVGLSSGEKIIVSNPLSDFLLPSPEKS